VLLRRWSSRTLAIACGIGGAAVSVLMYAFGFANIVTVFVFLVLTGAFIGLFNVLQPTMIADAVDTAEEKTGVRNDGISFATLTFTAKVMSAFAVLVFGLVVAAAGYENGVAVTPAMQETIWFGFTIVPAISCLLSAVAFWFYRLEPKKAEPKQAEPSM
jgi:Na+/melibiose symporter-like transporter